MSKMPGTPALLAAAVALALSACTSDAPSADTAAPAEAAQGAPDEGGAAEGGADEGAEGGTEEGAAPGAADSASAAGAAVDPGSAPEAAAAAREAALAPPPLATLMRRVGFPEASPADLTDFVHVPPGAEGEAGVFGGDERTVRAALIAYPNARYAAPHLTDVQERVRVLPNAREAAVAHDRWIVHVMAVDLATAERVASDIAATLGW